MIIVYHKNGIAESVVDHNAQTSIPYESAAVSQILFELADSFPDRILVWCEQRYKTNINLGEFESIFQNAKTMASFSPGANFLPDSIGFIEETFFIKVDKTVKYPTWQMSSAVGGIHGAVLRQLQKDLQRDNNFDYFLHSLAKLAMPLGLFCYSEPRLLIGNYSDYNHKATPTELFRFVRQHFTSNNFLLLALNLLLRERRFPFFAILMAAFSRKRKLDNLLLEKIESASPVENHLPTLDVVIPTIGRKPYLYDTLQDFARQTMLPDSVIIVEQNPHPNAVSELDYVTSETWPFEIKHIFVTQPGACNARNIALEHISSEWVFLADDDIRIQPKFLEDVFVKINSATGHVFNICCLSAGQTAPTDILQQTSVFGTGCSILSRESIGQLRFDTAFEFGFGEDHDFGAKLIQRGFDISYIPSPVIEHVKAPVGGLRTKIKKRWENDEVMPKPSPTVMLYRMLHHSKQQLAGYQTRLFLKNYSKQPVKNPFKYFRKFKQQWNRSVHWATKLTENA